MYDFEWHKLHGAGTTSSAVAVVDEVLRFLTVSSVLDIGCGDGRWLAAFKARGVENVLGVDGPWTDRSRLLIDDAHEFRVHRLEEPLELDRRFDLVMSTEVAEHISSRHADQFVRNATAHADVVLFGAAIPYQGGFRHVNEAWPSSWAEKFDRVGFTAFDVLRSPLWNREDVLFWYKQNLILYVRSDRKDMKSDVAEHITTHNIQQLPLDVVHPEHYANLASYKQIAFKPLMRELPGGLAKKAVAMLARKT